MKHRFEFLEIYKAFHAFVKTQHYVVIRYFRCDLGREYTSNKFLELLALDGTMQQTSCINTPCTNTPEKNGVVEKKHRHIVETTRFLLLSDSILSEFWGKVVLTTVTLINTIPSSHISSISPFEKLHRYAPDYSFFRVSGCTCFVIKHTV